MSAPPNGPCAVCEASGLGCWRMSDGAWQCFGPGPVDPAAWVFITKLPTGARVYNPKRSRPTGSAAKKQSPESTPEFAPFPLDVLPKPHADYSREYATAIGCDPSF